MIPKPVTKIDELKKMGKEFVTAVGYYATHLNEIGDNEWGFLSLGVSVGSIMALLTYFIIGTLFGSSVVEPPPVVADQKKKN